MQVKPPAITDDKIESIDSSMCGSRECIISFAKAVADLRDTQWQEMLKSPLTATQKLDAAQDTVLDDDSPIDAFVKGIDFACSTQVSESPLPMHTAPRDGTIVRLLVEFEDHPLEDDTSKPLWTIGGNTSDNTGIETEWQFAGWCWTHDRFTEGVGKPIGWLPMLSTGAPVVAAPHDAVGKLLEAYNFGQFAGDANWPLAQPVRATIRTICDWLASETTSAIPDEPIDVVLFCPVCGLQHIDESEDLPMSVPGSMFEGSAGWTNPPHRSHLCHGCGHIWRPADVPTNGVKAVLTKGRADSPIKGSVAAPSWSECKRISELPQVDEALRLFADGETTEDQAVAIVQVILGAKT